MNGEDIRFCVLAAILIIQQITVTIWLNDLSADVRLLKRRK